MLKLYYGVSPIKYDNQSLLKLSIIRIDKMSTANENMLLKFVVKTVQLKIKVIYNYEIIRMIKKKKKLYCKMINRKVVQ